MRKLFPSLLASFCIICSPQSNLQAEAESSITQEKVETPKSTIQVKAEKAPLVTPIPAPKFQPFTGKISKNKVRVRLQSSYDGPVLKELGRNDLVVVLGETEDFYAIQPPSDFKAYVFRTYVLDNVIEGNKVNVRLKPELEAPVVAQLNSGDRVDGTIYDKNNKWLEIKLPSTARFYIAKEYIEKAGDVGLKARLEKKHDEAINLFTTTEAMSKLEMEKPFEQINIDTIKANYLHLLKDFPEFPEIENNAKNALASLQETYTLKKVAYLEKQTQVSTSTFEANKKLAAELQAQKSKVSELEQQLEKNIQLNQDEQGMATLSPQKPSQLPLNMSAWLPVEQNLFAEWSQQTGKNNPQDFYDEQKQQSFVLRGIVDAYNRPIKNKPGDYMLLSTGSKLPIAFLYSTHINLQDYIGHEVAIVVSPRPNNHFAFPAYFVLSMD